MGKKSPFVFSLFEFDRIDARQGAVVKYHDKISGCVDRVDHGALVSTLKILLTISIPNPIYSTSRHLAICNARRTSCHAKHVEVIGEGTQADESPALELLGTETVIYHLTVQLNHPSQQVEL